MMERDLALIRAMRAQRERDAQALEVEKSAKELEDRLGGNSGGIACPASRLDETGNAVAEDETMLDQPANQGSNPYNSLDSKDVLSAQGLDNPILASGELPRQTGGSKGLVMSIDTRPHEKTPSPATVKMQNTADTTEQNLETPSTANLRDMEFETMFNDTDNAGSSSGMEFNFSFALTASTDQGPVNESSQGVGFSNKDSTNSLPINENNNSAEFEKYVNTGQEFSMIGISPSSKISQNSSNSSKIAVSYVAQDSGTTDTQLDSAYKYSHKFATAPENYDMGGEDIMDMVDLNDWLK